MENLLEAWGEFLKGKRNKKDVQNFSLRLMDNVLLLHNELANQIYQHGGYTAFKINDPKPRDIHKAGVRDRLLHHAVYRILYPFFERTFVADSYSCRLEKGTHKAINRFRNLAHKVNRNNTRTCWALKCDVKKFFASINHGTLIKTLQEYIPDEKIIWLLENVIESFSSGKTGAGIPLGNLTSQLFANIYLNKLDQFVKHRLKARYYIRYADDFVVLSENRKWLERQIEPIRKFLREELKLELHPDKAFIRKFHQGIDFLGYVILTHYRVLRTKTKKRVLKKIKKRKLELDNGKISEASFNQHLQSYLGILEYCEGYKIKKKIRKILSGFPLSRE
ncbi:MAG: reverse transcriptase/maturase family protein [Candidatus Moraniibacteriota bacterium]